MSTIETHEHEHQHEHDYVVVGAGSAGCVLASRLSEDPAVRVCLLEAGGSDRNVLIQCPAGLALLAKGSAVNWGFETVPQAGLNGRRGYVPRGKVLGGSSSINADLHARAARGLRRLGRGRQPGLGLGRRAAVLPPRRAQRARRRRLPR